MPRPSAPFVRFSRDERGYEYVYLVHADGPSSRSRVLYCFRTPPGLKVGRPAFTDEVQRAIVAEYPNLAFNWDAIRGAKAPPPPEVEPWRERRRAERPRGGRGRAEAEQETPVVEASAGVESAPAVTTAGGVEPPRSRRRKRGRRKGPAGTGAPRSDAPDPPNVPDDPETEPSA